MTRFKQNIVNQVEILTHLIYPNKCLICGEENVTKTVKICTICESDLPLTHFEKHNSATHVDKLFWGRCKIEATYSHFYFEKNKGSQVILFNLKYKSDPNLGKYFGAKIAQSMQQNNLFESVDVILPIPLHPIKKFKRGYNQSEKLATGISEITNHPIDLKTISRKRNAQSQTSKSRFERFQNVEGAFAIDVKIKNYKHVLLVDDVITTGSTIESIVRQINDIAPNVKVSVVTLAVA